jgi:hypothetical protein
MAVLPKRTYECLHRRMSIQLVPYFTQAYAAHLNGL